LAEVFVELADTLVADFDLVDFLSMLSERCVELLGGPEVGIMLSDARGNLRHMASSTEQMAVVELFELQHDEGPCLDCFRSGELIANERLDAATDRWPRFGPTALAAGYRMVSALPLRSRAQVIGAINVFHQAVEDIDPPRLRLIQAFADVATVGILQERAISGGAELASQLQYALNSRIAIEQAKGMLSSQMGVSVDQAFDVLRRHARRTNQRIVAVAAGVLDRSLRSGDLLRDTNPDGPAPG
jgi:hypothetical protein